MSKLSKTWLKLESEPNDNYKHHPTAPRLLWGTALDWMTQFGLAPETPVTRAYIDRIKARPSVSRAAEIDAEWLEKQEGLPQ